MEGNEKGIQLAMDGDVLVWGNTVLKYQETPNKHVGFKAYSVQGT